MYCNAPAMDSIRSSWQMVVMAGGLGAGDRAPRIIRCAALAAWRRRTCPAARGPPRPPSRYERIPQRKRQLRTYRCARRAPVGGADAALATVFCDLGGAHGARAA